MRQRRFSAWGIQTGPFAAHLAHFVPEDFQLFHFHTGRPILITPEQMANNGKREFFQPQNWMRQMTICKSLTLLHSAMPNPADLCLPYLSFASAAPARCFRHARRTANAVRERRVARTPSVRALPRRAGGENVRWTICLKRTDGRVVYCNSLR